MHINPQSPDSMAFGNKVRIVKAIAESKTEPAVYVAKRGEKLLGRVRNQNGDMKATSVYNFNSYTSNAKTYYATPISDFFNGLARKIKLNAGKN